jgi:hypothetical protein
MRKSEVEFHGSSPAVNVKNYGSIYTVPLPIELGGVSEADGSGFRVVKTDPAFNHEWMEAHEEALNDYAVFAAQDGWEYLEAQAQEIWGSHVKVYSEGRSGGWAVVEGLDPFESWNAIALAKWARFQKIAKAIAEDFPRAILVSAYLNDWEND